MLPESNDMFFAGMDRFFLAIYFQPIRSITESSSARAIVHLHALLLRGEPG
jgi:hypothetical protein